MNKTELISAIAKRTGLPKSEVNKMLNAYIDVVSETLAEGDIVQLVGFGKFSTSDVKEHFGRNPMDTTEVIKIPQSKRVYFSAGSKLKDRINK